MYSIVDVAATTHGYMRTTISVWFVRQTQYAARLLHTWYVPMLRTGIYTIYSALVGMVRETQYVCGEAIYYVFFFFFIVALFCCGGK